ncbi:MAG: hypothetical protein COA78_02430 [Blastopirellula sp.]|nr:MAG: hypothetical protein COA78_02430 [Blastopirellula sp.]
MSSNFPTDEHNPYSSPSEGYQPPGEPVGTGTPRRDSIDYFYAYNFVFESQNWVTTLLLSTLTMIIPLVGGIVLIGYHYEVIAVLAMGRGRPYPDYDFGRFGEYLTRGVWVFLVSLCAGLLVQVIIAPLVICGWLMIGIAVSIDPVLGIIGMFFFILLMIACSIIPSFIMTPLTLRAGLTKNFGEAFDFAFVKDFVSKMWVEQILVALFMSISSLFVVLAGGIMFCVGMYPALVLVMMAYTHIQFQLYQVYLSRGGVPIRIAQ